MHDYPNDYSLTKNKPYPNNIINTNPNPDLTQNSTNMNNAKPNLDLTQNPTQTEDEALVILAKKSMLTETQKHVLRKGSSQNLNTYTYRTCIKIILCIE